MADKKRSTFKDPRLNEVCEKFVKKFKREPSHEERWIFIEAFYKGALAGIDSLATKMREQ